MFPILRRHWTLWSLWTAASTAILYANAWAPFHWAELLACLGSLLLIVDRRIPRDGLLAVGLPTIVLLAILDGQGASVVRLLLDGLAFVGGAFFAARAVQDQRDLEAVAGQIAVGTDPASAYRAFREDLEDEIARARRHERPFAVLSIAPHPRAAVPEPLSEGELLRHVARARQILELSEVLRDVLHRYTHVVATAHRVVCCVPELEDEALDPLVARLSRSIDEALGIQVEIGTALFPREGLSVDDLIAAADDARGRPHLESVWTSEPAPARASSPGGSGTLADVQGSLRDARS